MELEYQALFIRNIGTITKAQQLRLQESTVTVIGCGGLGGFVIEELARLGIGNLHICDPDRFSISNINRQLYAQTETIGQYKAAVAAKRVHLLHGQTTVLPVTTRFQEEKEQLLANTEVVVDCLDNVGSRRELAELCNQYQIPLVHGAVQQWYGQVGVQLAGGTLIQDLYGLHVDDSTTAPSILASTVAVIASIQVAETCKLLLGLESPLHNNWINIDLQRVTFDIIDRKG